MGESREAGICCSRCTAVMVNRWKSKSSVNRRQKSARGERTRHFAWYHTSPSPLISRASRAAIYVKLSRFHSSQHSTPATITATMTTWATELFGPKLLTKPKTSGLPTESRFQGKKLVAIYFSASW